MVLFSFQRHNLNCRFTFGTMPGKFLCFDPKDHYIPKILSLPVPFPKKSGKKLILSIIAADEFEQKVAMRRIVFGWLHLRERLLSRRWSNPDTVRGMATSKFTPPEESTLPCIPVRKRSILMQLWWWNCPIGTHSWEEPSVLVLGRKDSQNRTEKFSARLSLEQRDLWKSGAGNM